MVGAFSTFHQYDTRHPLPSLQVAARMVGAFSTFRQYDTRRQEQMQAQLQRIVAQNGLSENVLEIASKSLAV